MNKGIEKYIDDSGWVLDDCWDEYGWLFSSVEAREIDEWGWLDYGCVYLISEFWNWISEKHSCVCEEICNFQFQIFWNWNFRNFRKHANFRILKLNFKETLLCVCEEILLFWISEKDFLKFIVFSGIFANNAYFWKKLFFITPHVK